LTAANDRVAAAAEEAATVQQELRRSGEQRSELARRLQRAEREVADAAALAGRLQSRADELRARIATIDASAAALSQVIEERDGATTSARSRLGDAERAQDEAREQRTAGQIAEAQA